MKKKITSEKSQTDWKRVDALKDKEVNMSEIPLAASFVGACVLHSGHVPSQMIDEFRKLVDHRGSELRTKSRLELLESQSCPTEHVELGGQAGTIDLIVEEEPEGSLRVVVQGFLATKHFPRVGVKHVALDGFRMNADGQISPLRDDEFYEFD